MPFRNATRDGQLAAVLWGIAVDRELASVLLTHARGGPYSSILILGSAKLELMLTNLADASTCRGPNKSA
jgi:hypothetical protein